MNKQDAEQATVQPSYNCTPRALDSQHRAGQQSRRGTFDSFVMAPVCEELPLASTSCKIIITCAIVNFN
ncbi:MAG: hypothetical protein RIT44_1045 [Pseudomonadota bacterium]|jgi:hypothetical protein